MNFLRRSLLRLALKGVDPQELSLTDPTGWQFLTGGPTWAKVNVGEETQLSISAAFSAIRAISETVGTLPLHLYRTTDRGSVKATEHPLYRLVHDQPNEYMTTAEWKEAMTVSLATMGQSYNYVNALESTGRIVSIQPVHKSRVQPEVKADGSIRYGLTLRNGQRVELPRERICPIRGFGGVGDLEGYAPHRLHANSMALTIAVEKYGAEFFGSGARPTGVLTTKTSFREQSRDELRASFAKYMRESWLKGELPVLDGETTYNPITTPNNEAQFIETRRLQIAEIARIYRVPLSMLMDPEKTSYASASDEREAFYIHTLVPYINRIEKGLNSSLLTPQEQRTHFFQFDARGLLRGNSEQRSNYYLKMRTAGAMSQNEIRQLEDMETREGADDLHVPLNMAPSDLLRNIQEHNLEK